MPWPSSQDYNEAVQNLAHCFADPDLQSAQADTNALGLPLPHSGNFADVYQLRSPAAGRSWAVKCFTRQVPGLRDRYRAVSAHLAAARLPFTVDFDYLEQGARVRDQWHPALKMDWVEGLLLNEFVRRHLDRPALLEALADLWVRLGRRLRREGIAHGDLQHGNVLLVPGRDAGALALKLIDYDGMWVPALAGQPSGEVGHPAYQHPRRLREQTYSAEVDRFPLLVIYTAVRALAVGGRPLWGRHDNGDNLLFGRQDFEAPGKSALFYELLKLGEPSVRFLAENLIDAARKPLEETPLLEELVPGGQAAPGRGEVGQAPPAAAEAPPAVAVVPLAVALAPEATAGPPEAGPVPSPPDHERGPRWRVIAALWVALAGAVALLGVLAGVIALVAYSRDVHKRGQAQAPSAPRVAMTKAPAPGEETPVGREADTPTKLYLSKVGGFDWAGYGGLGKGTTTADTPTFKTVVNGVKHPLSLGMHPYSHNHSQVRYRLRGLKARWFTSSVAVDDSAGKGPESPLTFVVSGDGKTLWTSKPVQLARTTQECRIDVSGIDLLELRVNCPGGNNGAAAVWLDPYITTELTKTELDDYLDRKPYPVDLRIVAAIDGSDNLRITASEARWVHISWTHPTSVKMDGVE
jgi:hypothetical protein